jgi:MFS family permease
MSLPFYRHVQGTDDMGGNLVKMLWWVLGYAIVLVPSGVIALRTSRKKSWTTVAAVFLLVAAVCGSRFSKTDWNSMIQPLPVCLLAALIVTVVPLIRRGSLSDRIPLRLALVVFAIALLGKIILSPHVYHYGFALAMPGTLVLIAALSQDFPGWIEKRGGCGNVLRAGALAAGLAGVAAILYVDAGFWGTKRWMVFNGADTFRGATRALEVQMMADLINRSVPPDGTLEVFPQGLMINYLTRRASPTAFANFMPPEVLAAGEERMLAALVDHPPDAVVVNSSAVNGDQFAMDTDYMYGRETFAWIRRNYDVMAVAELPPPYPTFLRLVLMRRKMGDNPGNPAVRVLLPGD